MGRYGRRGGSLCERKDILKGKPHLVHSLPAQSYFQFKVVLLPRDMGAGCRFSSLSFLLAAISHGPWFIASDIASLLSAWSNAVSVHLSLFGESARTFFPTGGHTEKTPGTNHHQHGFCTSFLQRTITWIVCMLRLKCCYLMIQMLRQPHLDWYWTPTSLYEASSMGHWQVAEHLSDPPYDMPDSVG